MKADELMAAYDAAKAASADLADYPSLRRLTREQIKDAAEKYDRLKRG